MAERVVFVVTTPDGEVTGTVRCGRRMRREACPMLLGKTEPANCWADAVPIIVAVAALLFTVASFWWLNARPGRLVAAPPRAYALANVPLRGVRLRLPLAICNTGTRARVVSNVRCRFPDLPDATVQPWHSTRTILRPSEEDFEDYPTPFAVDGRHALLKCSSLATPTHRSS